MLMWPTGLQQDGGGGQEIWVTKDTSQILFLRSTLHAGSAPAALGPLTSWKPASGPLHYPILGSVQVSS